MRITKLFAGILKRIGATAVASALCCTMACAAISGPDSTKVHPKQMLPVSENARPDSLLSIDSRQALVKDTAGTSETRTMRDWATWKPTAKRAMWLSIVLPGAGQIYNHKYWKLPIIYGGFVGCAYAMRWNNMMYHDYSKAYIDIMDGNPETHSYNEFLHLGTKITSENLSRWQEIFRQRKDRYRRWRDLSFFVMVGVYALSVIDAYVDASLSDFDISRDLSLHVVPCIIPANNQNARLGNSALGLQCQITF